MSDLSKIADNPVALFDRAVELEEQLAYHDAPDQAFLDLQATNRRQLLEIRELMRTNSLIRGQLKAAKAKLKKAGIE